MRSELKSSLGYGLMSLTWKPVSQVKPDEQAFEVIKTAVDGGCTFLDSGEFYGTEPKQANLQLLARFYKAYPDYVDKTFLSVKGGIDLEAFRPDASTKGLRRSVEAINKELGGLKKMDMFECARVDPNVPIEKVMRDLKDLIAEGHFKYISLSECSAKTIRRAAKVATISAVEVEYSPFSLDIEKNGVLAACNELSIPVIAYSPLARGILTGSVKSPDDIPEGDMRKHFDRFQPDVFDKNLKLVKQLQTMADKKGITIAQLSLAWLLAQGVIPIPGSTRKAGVEEGIGAVSVKFSKDELAELRKMIDAAEVHGGRYNEHLSGMLEGDSVEETS